MKTILITGVTAGFGRAAASRPALRRDAAAFARLGVRGFEVEADEDAETRIVEALARVAQELKKQG